MFWFVFSSVVLFITYLGIETNYKYFFRIILILILSGVVGFGCIVGRDVSAYETSYNSYNIYNWNSFIEDIDFKLAIDRENEFGFVLINYIGVILGLGFPGLMFFISCFINFIYVKSIYKSPYPVIAMLFYITSVIYFQQCNLVRQSIAMSLFVCLIPLLENKKWLLYVLGILLSSLFHTSALIFLPLVVLCFVDFDKRYKVVVGVMGLLWFLSFLVACVGVNGNVLESYIMQLVGETSYEDYASMEQTLGFEKQNISIFYNLCCLYAIVCLYLKRKDCDSIHLIMIVLACVTMNLATQIIQLARISYYFIAVLVVYIGNLVVVNKRELGLKKIFPIIIKTYVILYYGIRILFVNNIMLENSPLGSEFYPLTMFFM